MRGPAPTKLGYPAEPPEAESRDGWRRSRAGRSPYHGPVTSMAAPDAATAGDGRSADITLPSDQGRTYQVRTYGCQMNVHDSERLAGLLEAAGYRRAPGGDDADVGVLHTCPAR